jgi:protein MpaA
MGSSPGYVRALPKAILGIALLTSALTASLPRGGGVPAGAATPSSEVVLGYSVEGRPIIAYERSGSTPSHHIAVFGVIHGEEPAGTAVTDALRSADLPADVRITVIPSMNPDGEAVGQRGNAHGVDLNRNFPHGWLPADASPYTVGGYYPGTHPLSEPESQAVYNWLVTTRPSFALWYHQPWGSVVCNDGSGWECTSFASAVGMPVEYAPRPGSVADWASANGTPSAVVELPARGISADEVSIHVAAILGTYAAVPPAAIATADGVPTTAPRPTLPDVV